MEPEVHQISLISEKSVVIYNIYSQEGNYFRREEGKFHFWVENS